MDKPLLQLMSRKACCLCDEALAEISKLVEQGLCELEVIDVDQDIRLAALYGMDVPVLLQGGRVLMKHHVDQKELIAQLKGEMTC